MAGNAIGDFDFVVVQSLTTRVFNEDDVDASYDFTHAWLRAILTMPETEHYDTIMAAFINLIYRKTKALDDVRHNVLLTRCVERFKDLPKREIIKIRNYYEKNYYTSRKQN